MTYPEYVFSQANFEPEVGLLIGMTFLRPTSTQRTHSIYAVLIAANIFMASLIMVQGRIIETQQVLIKSLFFDTTQLAAIKQALHHR